MSGSTGSGVDRLCLVHHLQVLWYKARALAGSLASRQPIDGGSFPVSYVELHRDWVE